jgi:hypothetical protein
MAYSLHMATEFSSDPAPQRSGVPTDRIRTGVTGLAFILLVVALATAIATGVRRSANASDTARAPTPADLSSNKTENADPLAPLGVTPPMEAAPLANGTAKR